LDTETTGKNVFRDVVVGASVAWRTNEGLQAVYVPWGHAEGNIDAERARQWLREAVRDRDVVFANAKFDIHCLKNSGVDVEAEGCRPHDVAFADALLDDERIAGHGLHDLGLRYVGEGKAPFPGEHMERLPSWMVGAYAEQDARLTFRIDEAVTPMLREQGLVRVRDLEDAVIYCTCHIERVGSRIDMPTLDVWRREVRAVFESCLWQLYSMTGLQINPMSADSLLVLLKHVGGGFRLVEPKNDREKPYYLLTLAGTELRTSVTKKGKVSITDDVVERLAGLHPAFQPVLRGRRYGGLLTKFLDKFWADADGDVIRAQYHQLKTDDDVGAVSGRYSSTGGGKEDNGYSFNAQQTIKPSAQRKDGTDRWTIRQLFIPADGMRYFAVDAKQIEYRLFGHFANARRIIDAYNNDELTDMHQVATDIAAQHAPVLAAQWGAKFRDHVKNVNFARLYGARSKKIASMLGITEQDAEAFVGVLDKVFPEAAPYLRRKAAEAEQRGFVTTLLGRRARFTSEHNRRGTHSAVNRVIQGTAADLMKLKMLRVYNERATLGITAIRQTIHDELDGDVLPDPVYERRMAECFAVQEVKLKCPIAWDMHIVDTNWLDAK
jgi:DNA polymerase-1